MATDDLYTTGSVIIYEAGTPTGKMEGEEPEGKVEETIPGGKTCPGHEWVGKDCHSPSYCSICGIAGGPATHTGGTEIRGAVEGTCHTDGYSGDTYCKGCGEKLASGTNTGKVADNHDGNHEIRGAVEGNCHTEGYTGDWYCKDCGAIVENGISTGKVADKHDGGTEIRGAVEATCSKEGYTGDTYCKGCGVKLADGETVAKKAHTVVIDNAVEPDCTHTGLTAGKHCSMCNEVLVAQEVVKAKGHTPGDAVRENEKAAQPGQAGGYEKVVYCTMCGAELNRTVINITPLPQPDPAPAPAPSNMISKIKLVEAEDEGNQIRISFFSDNTFIAYMEDGSQVKGTYKYDIDSLVLYYAGYTVRAIPEGAFSFIWPEHPDISYSFTLSPDDLSKLIG